ncbi:hypothetical protein [Tardiphaga sp.]|uniref:hypothetical protein n=1 Tax=Tardiphaga sp. TaxID=1926292 RepID=UPI0037DA69C0
MPNKHPDAERFGGPGSSQQDRKHPEKADLRKGGPAAGSPTGGRKSKVSGGGGERDAHHSHDRETKS